QRRPLQTIYGLGRDDDALNRAVAATLAPESDEEGRPRELRRNDAAHAHARDHLAGARNFMLQPGSGRGIPQDLPPVLTAPILRRERRIDEAVYEADKARATRALA